MKANSILAQNLIGAIPNDWSYIRMKDIYRKPIRDFGSFSSTKLITFLDEGVPFIKSEMIKEGWIDWTSTQYVSQEVHAKLTKSYVTENTILFSKIGSALGKAVVYDGKRGVCNSNAAVAKIELDSQLADNDYYSYLLNNPLSKKQFNRLIISLLPRINLGDISDLILPLPPLPEQRKIAKILSTWDRGIATTEKLIDASKQQKKALMQQLLMGKKRLLDPETGKAFEGDWEEVKLDDLALYRRGSFPQPYGNPEWVDEVNGYPFIQVFDIDKNMKLKKVTKTKISDAAIDKSVFIEAGTVIVSLQGSIGRVAITQYDAYVDRTVLLFQSFKRKMDTIYFAYAIKELFEIEKEKAPGGTIKTITKQVLSNFTIKVPTHYEQQKIASVLTAADKDIELLEAKLAHFKQEKKALMQQLLTGKRRVNIAETKVTTEEILEAEVA